LPARCSFRFGVGASAFLLPLMLQLAFGLDALELGAHHVFRCAGGAGSEAARARLPASVRFPAAADRQWGAGLTVLLASALFTPSTPHLVITVVLLAGGFLRSLQFTSLSAITYADIEPRQVGSATGMASVGQQVSVSLGVAMGAMAVEVSEWARGHAVPETSDFLGGLRGGGAHVDGDVVDDAAPAGRRGRRDVGSPTAATRGLQRSRPAPPLAVEQIAA